MRLVFLRSQTEWGSDGEQFVAVDGNNRETTIVKQLKFHGGRALGASGHSSVSGPPQCEQLSTASDSEVFTFWVFSLLVVAESNCLAFSSS